MAETTKPVTVLPCNSAARLSILCNSGLILASSRAVDKVSGMLFLPTLSILRHTTANGNNGAGRQQGIQYISLPSCLGRKLLYLDAYFFFDNHSRTGIFSS
jgi:hypothetical protein